MYSLSLSLSFERMLCYFEYPLTIAPLKSVSRDSLLEIPWNYSLLFSSNKSRKGKNVFVAMCMSLKKKKEIEKRIFFLFKKQVIKDSRITNDQSMSIIICIDTY